MSTHQPTTQRLAEGSASNQRATPSSPGQPSPERRHVPLRRMCAEPHHCPPNVRLAVLSQVPLFAGVPRDELPSIDARATSLAWSADEAIYRAGEAADHLYVVAAGRAKAVRSSPGGEEHVVDLLAPGDLFGGLPTLGATTHTETVVAMTTTCVLQLNAAHFRDILLEHPSVALRALEDTAQRLAHARSDLTGRTGSVAQRLAGTLLRLADKFGEQRAGGEVLIEVPLTRADLAAMTGSTPESVSRAMSTWRKAGIVDSGRRWTAIRDRAALADIAAGQ